MTHGNNFKGVYASLSYKLFMCLFLNFIEMAKKILILPAIWLISKTDGNECIGRLYQTITL